MSDEPEILQINEDQWREVNSALLAAIGICGVHVPTMRDQMIKASIVMDDIVDASEEAEFAALRKGMSKPEDIPQDVWSTASALEAGLPDYAKGRTKSFVEPVARAIMAERRSGDDIAKVLKDILEALRTDAPGTPLNNHKYDQLGIRAYDAIRKRGGA